MEFLKDRISMRQAVIFFMISLGAPSLRVVPNYIARVSEESGWVSTFFGLGFSILLVLVLAELFRKNDGSLYDVYESVFGKSVNKVITTVYIVWSFILAAMYLRMFGERYLGTILFNANITAILIFMAILIYFLVNQKIDVIGRISEILFAFFAAIIIIIFITIIPQIKLENIWPVTYYDIWPIIKGVLPLSTISCYITAVMFFGDKISNKHKLKKYGIIGMTCLGTLALILILSTTGMFGYRVSSQFLFPYFITLKNIKILNAVGRVESLFISTWLGTDAIIISLFTMVGLHLLKRLFNQETYKRSSIWCVLAILVFAIFMAPNAYALESWARQYVSLINVALFIGMPAIALIVGKIRKIV